MSYTPSNIIDKQSIMYGSSGADFSPIWQTAQIVFDARTGFFVEWMVNPDSAIRIKLSHFRAEGTLASVLVRVLNTLGFRFNEKLSFTLDTFIKQSLKDIAFSSKGFLNIKPLIYRKVSNIFSSKLVWLVKALFDLNAIIKFGAKSFIYLKPGVIIPESILSIPGENTSFISFETIHLAYTYMDCFKQSLDFHLDTRNIVPIEADVLPKFTMSSGFSVEHLVPNKSSVYLPDGFIQPVDSEAVNEHRIVFISFDKFIELFFEAFSVIHWINTTTLKRIEPIVFEAIGKFYVSNLAQVLWVFTRVFTEYSKFSVSISIVRTLAVILSSIFNFVADGIIIKNVFVEDIVEDSSFEFINTWPVKRRIDVIFNFISAFELFINFWREGRPAIRVTTLQHDILRNPRGRIVILEDPTL